MKKIVIIIPGLGYNADKPLLYYGLEVARECGYQEYRKLSFTALDKGNIRRNETALEDAFEELYKQAEAQLQDIAWEEYDDILFISKSIGTIIACAYAAKHSISTARHILYTPLRNTFKYDIQKAIAFIGTADGWSDYSEIVELSEKADIPLIIYENCNHSLEVTDDVSGNISRLLEIEKKTKEFIKAI